jgi:hypothetical protein
MTRTARDPRAVIIGVGISGLAAAVSPAKGRAATDRHRDRPGPPPRRIPDLPPRQRPGRTGNARHTRAADRSTHCRKSLVGNRSPWAPAPRNENATVVRTNRPAPAPRRPRRRAAHRRRPCDRHLLRPLAHRHDRHRNRGTHHHVAGHRDRRRPSRRSGRRALRRAHIAVRTQQRPTGLGSCRGRISSQTVPALAPGTAHGGQSRKRAIGVGDRISTKPGHLPAVPLLHRSQRCAAQPHRRTRTRLRRRRRRPHPGPAGCPEQRRQHALVPLCHIRMPQWHKGCTVLCGGSAWCTTLYSGSAVALEAAATLSGALTTTNDIPFALARWEQTMRPAVAYHQRQALRMQRLLLPANTTARTLRSAVIRLSHLPGAPRESSTPSSPHRFDLS